MSETRPVPESQHTFPVFHPRANKVISFVGSAAEQEGPTASRLEASSYPPPGSRGRKPPGLAWGRGFLSSSPYTSSLLESEPSLPQWYPRLSPSAFCGSPDPSICFPLLWEVSLGVWPVPQIPHVPHGSSLASPMFFMFRNSGTITVHPANQNEGHNCTPCPIPLARKPDILVWAPQLCPRLHSLLGGKGSCLAELSPTLCTFSRDRLGSPLCPSAWQSGTWESQLRKAYWANEWMSVWTSQPFWNFSMITHCHLPSPDHLLWLWFPEPPAFCPFLNLFRAFTFFATCANVVLVTSWEKGPGSVSGVA